MNQRDDVVTGMGRATAQPEVAEDEALVRNWPFYWLTRVMVRYTDSVTSALDGSGLDLPSWRALMILRGSGWLSVSELASQSNTKLAAMTKTVQRMKADGLVESRESATDRRVTLVTLTSLGEHSADVAMRATQHVFRRAFHGMSRRELDHLSQVLHDVADNLR